MLTQALQFIRPTREYREMALLSEIGKNSASSQRALARVAMVSATMVNAYVDRLVERGDVEVTGETNRSYRYLLTSSGSTRRDEMLFQISREAVRFYGRMKEEFRRRLAEFEASGVRRVVLYGAAETAELVGAAARSTGVDVVGIVDADPQKQGQKVGDTVVSAPSSIRSLNPDAVIITSFGHADEIHRQVQPLEEQGIRILRL